MISLLMINLLLLVELLSLVNLLLMIGVLMILQLLNPNLLQEAIAQEYPRFKPDFLRACRLDILDQDGQRFEGEERD